MSTTVCAPLIGCRSFSGSDTAFLLDLEAAQR